MKKIFLKENTEYLELFIIVDNTKFQLGLENLLFFHKKIYHLLKEVITWWIWLLIWKDLSGKWKIDFLLEEVITRRGENLRRIWGKIHRLIATMQRRPFPTRGPGELRLEGREEVEDGQGHQRDVVGHYRPRGDHLAVAHPCCDFRELFFKDFIKLLQIEIEYICIQNIDTDINLNWKRKENIEKNIPVASAENDFRELLQIEIEIYRNRNYIFKI